MENIISVSHLSFGYDSKRKVLENINFQLKKGESVGLVGANGVGKSTLLRILVGLNTGFQGDVMVNNIPLEKKNLKIIRKNVGYVFQDADSQLFMSTMEALKVVHIEQLKDKQIYKLSGGEKKLASIATILSTEPDVILMDEPSVALDPKNRRNLINILNQLNQAKIIASHDLNMIMDTCERTILLSDGKVIKDGNTKEILLDKELMEESGLELPLGY